MINLLPPDVKEGYRYARRNRHLVQWASALSLVIAGAALLTAVGVLFLHQSAERYDRQTATIRSQLKAQNYDATQKEVAEMSGNLQLMLQVLSKQIVFSELLNRLGVLMPDNTALAGLSISQTQGALDITAQATDYTAATQLQVNLADKNNQVFTKVDIVGITCPNTSGSNDRPLYPCTVTLRALLDPNSSFLFIANQKSTKRTPAP